MKAYINDHNEVFSVMRDHLDIVPPYEADVILSWEDRSGEFADWAFYGGDGKHKPHLHDRLIITFQHGRRGLPTYWHKWTYCLVWGEKDKEEMIVRNIAPPQRIFVTGSLIFEKLKPKREHRGKNVVFFPIALKEGYKIDHEITEELGKIEGVDVTTKITEGRNPDDYINPVYGNTQGESNFDILAELLSTADVVVGAEESTVQLMAQHLDIPTVVVRPESYVLNSGKVDKELDERQLKDDFFSGGVKLCSVEDLNETIYQQLENPDELKEGRRQACIDFGGTHIKDPVSKTLGKIEELYEIWKSNTK